MNKTKLSYFDNEYMERTLEIVESIQAGDVDIKYAPWLRNVYFAGRTLFLDVNLPCGGKDSFTFCHADEDVGFFSGGFRKLLSIKALRTFERIMLNAGINHTHKWN